MTGDPATPGTGPAEPETRDATAGDHDSVVLLCAAALEFDVRRDAEAFPEILARRAMTHLVAYEGGRLVGTIFGSLDDRDRGVGHIDLIAVDPASRRRGVGRRLLADLEERLRAAGAREFVAKGNPPWYAWAGVDVRYTPAICLFESAGYVRDGEAHNMATTLRGRGELLDTTAEEERLAAEGVIVRRLEPYDEPAIRPWLEGWANSWADEALAGLRYDPVRCHVALDTDQRWLGFAAWGINAPTVFGPMGTDEAARRRGIGTVLLRRCLADQYVEEMDLAEIGWAGPYGFYARTVDAYISRIFWTYRKPVE